MAVKKLYGSIIGYIFSILMKDNYNSYDFIKKQTKSLVIYSNNDEIINMESSLMLGYYHQITNYLNWNYVIEDGIFNKYLGIIFSKNSRRFYSFVNTFNKYLIK